MARRSTTLPKTLDQLAGLRIARWVRESTRGQLDNFGPDTQNESIDNAVARWGLTDTGLVWTVASSGWKKSWLTNAWREMIAAAAAGEFDVVVVGYASRFSRNLKQTLMAIEDQLHASGVALLFANEALLSSNPAHWESFTRAALEAEAYSRMMSRTMEDTMAIKRRKNGVPGGNRAPYGVVREGKPSRLRVDEDTFPIVRRAFDLAAAGMTDRGVAIECGLKLTHVHEVLTNRFYAGYLQDGAASSLGPLIDPAVFDVVQGLRARYRRRHRGSLRRRQYALSMLINCAACGRRLTGHGGRYRHVDACEPFRAAAPRVRRSHSRNYDRRVRGESYRAELYDDLVGTALEKVLPPRSS